MKKIALIIKILLGILFIYCGLKFGWDRTAAGYIVGFIIIVRFGSYNVNEGKPATERIYNPHRGLMKKFIYELIHIIPLFIPGLILGLLLAYFVITS